MEEPYLPWWNKAPRLFTSFSLVLFMVMKCFFFLAVLQLVNQNTRVSFYMLHSYTKEEEDVHFITKLYGKRSNMSSQRRQCCQLVSGNPGKYVKMKRN